MMGIIVPWTNSATGMCSEQLSFLTWVRLTRQYRQHTRQKQCIQIWSRWKTIFQPSV
ncbi:hypothetical protein C8R44DRAFT_762387 [Mycena epipterygia]|nr:hypothetical protein C8R44DRAFT_762387 [Mycena epipterygia]